jgi:hypothetical protein
MVKVVLDNNKGSSIIKLLLILEIVFLALLGATITKVSLRVKTTRKKALCSGTDENT